MHSLCSDGVLTPVQVLSLAEASGLNVMALTDHDCISGVEEIIGRSAQVQVIPGVELSLRNMRGLHLLCYGSSRSFSASPLHQRVNELCRARVDRTRQILDNLRQAGVQLDPECVIGQTLCSVGRLHIARAMADAGYVKSTDEAFRRYLYEGSPYFVMGQRLSMEEALPLALESGFVPVLAHPMELAVSMTTLRPLVSEWQRMGLKGIEVYHPSAGHRMQQLDSMARSMGMLVTGGSDFHKEQDKTHGMPGCMCRHWRNIQQDVDVLQTAIHSMN